MNNEMLKSFLKKPLLNIDKLLLKVYRHGYNEAIHDFYDISSEIIKIDKNKKIKKEDIEHLLLSVFDKCINQNKKDMLDIDND